LGRVAKFLEETREIIQGRAKEKSKSWPRTRQGTGFGFARRTSKEERTWATEVPREA